MYRTLACVNKICTNNEIIYISDTKATESLIELIVKPTFMRDIRQLSPLAQTSGLEAFHSVVIHFVPKMLSYSYKEMLCRYKNTDMNYTGFRYANISGMIASVALHDIN